jgi:thiamine-phosphate pyrophosphorylase
VSKARLDAARLYVVTPDRSPDQVVELVHAVVRGGAEVVQLRHKTLPRGELFELAQRLREVTAPAGVPLIINDHVDIALASGADGVHLGPDDLSVESARRLVPAGFLIGASASDQQSAGFAVRAGADYIGCGPAFSTPVKKEKGVIGPAGVAAVASSVGVPVFAIGGIDEMNVDQLVALGLHLVCVIRAVADAADPESAARRMRAMLRAAT